VTTRTGRYTPEQYERWHIRICARCGRKAGLSANWSDGPICRSCYDRAARTYGRCPGCQAERLLPGRRGDGAAVCRDCAGITRDFFCSRCGFEGLLLGGRLCERCTLTDRLTAVLDDGTGRVSPPLVPLFDALRAMPKPNAGLRWLRGAQVRDLLEGLAGGRIPLTHEALHPLPNWRAVAYLRDLLMACGALPTIDKQLLHHETWLHRQLAELDGQPHARLLRQFATWSQLPRLRHQASTRPLTTHSRRAAAEQFTQARLFLAWLDEHGRTPETPSQADIDDWHVTHLDHAKRSLRAFLAWAMSSGQLPRRDLPRLQILRAEPLTQRARLDLVKAVLTSETGSPATRAAACLMLLYAQPASRIVRLTVDDITRDGDEVLLRLGDPPVPVPEPFAALLLAAAAQRSNMTTATNPDSRWLFPGRRAGQPLHPGGLLDHIRALGIPNQAARTATLRQLVLQAPAPVVAQALGYHPVTTQRHRAEAGGTWTRYAPGDHGKRAHPATRQEPR
jgi:hypothetical protein